MSSPFTPPAATWSAARHWAKPPAMFAVDEKLEVNYPIKSIGFLVSLLINRRIIAFNFKRKTIVLDNGTVIESHLALDPAHEEDWVLGGVRASKLANEGTLGDFEIGDAYVGYRPSVHSKISALFVRIESAPGLTEWIELLAYSSRAAIELGSDEFAQRLNYATADRILKAAENEVSRASL